MRIDAHHHLWRYEPASFGWIEPDSVIASDFGLAELASAATGIADGSIAVQARQSAEETGFLLECAGQRPEILGVVGWIDLRADDIVEQLARPAAKLVGYRHVVQDEADSAFLLVPAFLRGVREVLRLGLSYDLLVNHDQLEDGKAPKTTPVGSGSE